jgi:Tfp pilus assembly protein PilV
MVGLNRKLSGTTLIESLVAMTLLVTIIALSFLSIISIKKSFNNDLRTYAYIIVNKYIEEVDSTNYNGEIYNFSALSLRISCEQYKNNPNLFTLTVSAISPDSIVLYEAKKVSKSHSSIKNTRNSN